MVSYHITEPHPSLPSSHFLHSGRGGAGNATRVNPTNITHPHNASGPASLIKLTPPPSSAYFSSGRGGAGNVHRERERAMFSFDEELAVQERLRGNAAPVFHVGRGGAGNAVWEKEPGRVGRTNSASSSASSAGSEGGREKEREGVRRSIEGAWHKVSRQFSR